MHHLQRNLRIRKVKDKTFGIKGYNEQLEDREVEVNENEYEEGINQQDMAEISFHAILRKTSGTTMKVEGTLEGRKVLTLVDSGSTHNFISASLVKQLGLKVSTVPFFGVQIGKWTNNPVQSDLSWPFFGVPSVVKTDASFQSYSKLPDATSDSSRPRVKVKENQGVDALSRRLQHRADDSSKDDLRYEGISSSELSLEPQFVYFAIS
ncbi:retrotransposon gag domain, retroviral aspartyl protease [Tanacetum coccineum]